MSDTNGKPDAAGNPFSRLAPFIQEFIYRAKWTELRDIQIQTSNAIFDTPGHVLITSGTASGKTEAAFLPIITALYNNPSSSVGVVYIGPFKALLNDQFQRLQFLLQESHIPVQSWHGDVADSQKKHFLEGAQGLLQITPESLEAMLLQPVDDLRRLFSDLRFVVIDEVHAFIADDRGNQTICQLQRLGRFQKTPARRVGLSATLGDPQAAMAWLAGGTDLPVTLVTDNASKRQIELGLENYPILPNDFDKRMKRAQAEADQAKQAEPKKDAATADALSSTQENGETATAHPAQATAKTEQAAKTSAQPPDESEPSTDSPQKSSLTVEALQQIAEQAEAFFHDLYQMTRRQTKTLVFANSRSEVEMLVGKLRELAVQDKKPDIYFTHHAGITNPMRESAEIAMRAPNVPACVVATITLELGIDLGELDQILQVRSPGTVASFVQRLGRSGRRGNASKMFVYSRERVPDTGATLGKRIPWDMLHAIATMQLYLEEKWLEPPEVRQFPFSLLYHQTMSILTAATELLPAQLAEQVLTLAPFAHITQQQYRTLLQHLIAINHIQRAENGALIVGLEGEKVVNNYQFYGTFKDEPTYTVQQGTHEIGSLQFAPHKEDLFVLDGRTWKATGINQYKHLVDAESSEGQAKPPRIAGNAHIHRHVLERIRQTLTEETQYAYLREHAQKRLAEVRTLAHQSQLDQAQVIALNEEHKHYIILPWQSTRTVETLIKLLEVYQINVIDSGLPYYFEIIVSDMTVDAVKRELGKIAAKPPAADQILETLNRKSLEAHKYDRFVPDSLLKEEYVVDRLDMAGAVAALQQIAGTQNNPTTAG